MPASLRSRSVLASTVAACGIAAAALLPGASALANPPAPIQANITPHCQDLSGVASMLPLLADTLPNRGAAMPTARVDITGNGPGSAPYEITVNGQRKGHGAVGPGGRVLSGVDIPQGQPSRVVVRSNGQVIADQMVQPRC